MGKSPMDSQNASPEQLEREIVQTRAEIDRKLNLIQRRLSPRRVAGQMADSVGTQGGAFVRNLGATLRENPVPAVLLGVGLCWLMFAGRDHAGQTDGGYLEVPDEPDEWDLAPAEPASSAPRVAAALAAAEVERSRELRDDANADLRDAPAPGVASAAQR